MFREVNTIDLETTYKEVFIMKVDFTKVETFKVNFDGCATYKRMGQLIRMVEDSEDEDMLALFKIALEYGDEVKIAAVYKNNSCEICDKDDLKVLIDNYPKGEIK